MFILFSCQSTGQIDWHTWSIFLKLGERCLKISVCWFLRQHIFWHARWDPISYLQLHWLLADCILFCLLTARQRVKNRNWLVTHCFRSNWAHLSQDHWSIKTCWSYMEGYQYIIPQYYYKGSEVQFANMSHMPNNYFANTMNSHVVVARSISELIPLTYGDSTYANACVKYACFQFQYF